MKIRQLIYIFLLLSCSGSIYAQNYARHKDVDLKFDSTRISVNFVENYYADERNKIIKSIAADKILPLDESKRCYSVKTIFMLKSGLTQNDVKELIAILNNTTQIAYAGTVVVYPEGALAEITNQICVKLQNENDIYLLEDRARELGLNFRKTDVKVDKVSNKCLNGCHMLEIPKNIMNNAYEIYLKIHSFSFFEVAEPLPFPRVNSHPENSIGFD